MSKKETDSSADQPGDIFAILGTLVEQMERLSGSEESEMRAKVQALRAEAEHVPSAQTQQMDELEVARELDELESKLESFDRKWADAGPEVQELLRSSAGMWLPALSGRDSQPGDSSEAPHHDDKENVLKETGKSGA